MHALKKIKGASVLKLMEDCRPNTDEPELTIVYSFENNQSFEYKEFIPI